MNHPTFRSSLRHACNGLLQAARSERNLRIHCVCAVLACTLAAWLGITRIEWLAIVFCIGLVITAELLNTAIEETVDLLSPEHQPAAGRAKDVAAAAALLAAVTAAVVGCLVFLPPLMELIIPTGSPRHE